MTPEEFCAQPLPRAIPAQLNRPDPWLLGGTIVLTVVVLWLTFDVLEEANQQVFVLVTYALLMWLFFMIGRRSRSRFRYLLTQGTAIQGFVSEHGKKSRELPKSTVTFFFVELTFPGAELGPVKQTVPEAAWYKLTESTPVSVLYDPAGKHGYLLVDILAL